MNTALSWIKAYVPDLDVTAQEYTDAMTLSGTKVEGYERLDADLDKIVIGQIEKIEKHPDADKLIVCQVNVGNETIQIVTGAPNVKEGDKEGVEETIRDFAQELREARSSQNRAIIYMQNLLLTVINAANLTEEQASQVLKEEKELMNRLYNYERRRDMATDVISICCSISELLGERRDSYGKKQAVRALEYIDQNYMNTDVSLNSVCSYLAMSTSYFSTLFKTHTGETFIEALTKKRMEKARDLLENTSKRAYEVAEEVGFSDPHYFSVAFKKATGKTPTEYAREKKNR